MSTKYHGDKNRFRQDADTPISIGDEWYGEPRPPYICNYCQRTLSRLVDHSQQNENWYCHNCSVRYNPEEELGLSLRTKSSLSVPSGPVENPAVSYPPEPSLRSKKKEVKGSLAELAKRGVKITSYTEGKG